jgi:hypothetical protein
MSERYVLLLRESDPRIAQDACASQEHALRHEVAARGGRVVGRGRRPMSSCHCGHTPLLRASVYPALCLPSPRRPWAR